MTYGSPRVPVRWDGTVRDLGIVHHFVTSGWVRYTTARDLTMELRLFPLELRYASTKNGRVYVPLVFNHDLLVTRHSWSSI